MADGQVSVGGALSYAWALLSQNWRSIWGALALNALSWTVLVAGLLASNLELVLAGFLAQIMTKYPVYGAIARAASTRGRRGEEEVHGHLGIRWRGMELRMLAADLLVSVFLIIIAMLVSIALLAPILGVIMNSGGDLRSVSSPQDIERLLGPQSKAILMAESWALRLILTFIGIRLSLALVASAISGRVAVLSTWRLTRGSFWRIFVAMLVVSVPLILALSVTGAGVSPASMAAVTPSEIFVYSLLTGVLAGAATTPLLAGVQLYFYKHLGPVPSRDDGQAKA